jgi:Tfp pilus assembly protein PilF
LYCKKSDLEKAKDYYQLALQIRKEQSDPKHVDVIESYNELAVVYRNTGDLEKAKDYYERALEIQKEQLQ